MDKISDKVTIIRNDKSWIESNAVEQLNKVSQLKGVIKAVGLPDLHAGKVPVGAAIVTEGIIYPHLIGNDIGCGMALFETGIKKTKLKRDQVLKKLQKLSENDNIDMQDFTKDSDGEFSSKIGTIGSGNHFAELQEIDTIYDREALDEIGISKKDIYLLVHSGSRSLGESILRNYIENNNGAKGLKSNTQQFEKYIKDHNKALNFAARNRDAVVFKIVTTLGGKKDTKVLESVHNGICEKVVDNKRIYIHRKGAAPSDIGYVVVAGTRGSKSYIVKPKNEKGLKFAFSISHGAGRRWARSGCKEKLKNMYSKKTIRNIKDIPTLVCKEKNLIYEEAPEAYKNIERVIEDMISADMITLVASLNPVITYKA